MSSLKMSYCYLAFRTNVLLNLCCPGHLSYYSPNESEPLSKWNSCGHVDLDTSWFQKLLTHCVYVWKFWTFLIPGCETKPVLTTITIESRTAFIISCFEAKSQTWLFCSQTKLISVQGGNMYGLAWRKRLVTIVLKSQSLNQSSSLQVPAVQQLCPPAPGSNGVLSYANNWVQLLFCLSFLLVQGLC